MGVLTDVEAKPMASERGGNSKPSHPMLTAVVAIIVGVSSGMVPAAFNQWANRNGSNDDLIALRTEVAGMRKQLDRIETRDLVPRSEFDRAVTRLEDRLRELERSVQSRSESNR